MALVDFNWYCNFGNGTSTGYYAVALRPNAGAVAAGAIRRQFTAPAVGSERCFVCIVAGTTAVATDATWVLTRGAKTTDGTVTWMECTGQAALNGDLTNTATWAQVKAATPAVLGQIIKRSNNASYQICTTAGAMSASEPAFSDTAGVTTTDTTAVWTSLGPVGNFTGGQAPHARLANVAGTNWFAAGNTVYVGDNHAETGTAVTFSPVINTSAMSRVLCHNRSGSYPPAAGDLMAGATFTASSTINLNGQGQIYYYGLTFIGAIVSLISVGGATTATGSQGNWHYFDNCSFQASGGSGGIIVGPNSGGAYANITWNNCTVKFATAAEYVNVQDARFLWRNTGQVLAAGSSVPAGATALIMPGSGSGGRMANIVLEALDLSQITGSIFNPTSTSTCIGGTFDVRDCKLNASATLNTAVAASQQAQLVRSDSGATAYKSTRTNYEGAETTETSITRVGGAVDPSGQAQARKIVTNANANFLRPFWAEPYAIWNAVTGSNVTVTVCGTVNAGAVPNNDDIWLEVEYLGSATDPLGKIVTTTKASVLASNAAVASDSSVWNGGGSGAGWSPFKLTTTLSSPQPQLPGYLHARIRAAKPSTTYYIDPQVILS